MSGEAGSRPSAGRGSEVLLVDFDAGEHGHRGQYNAMLAQLFAIRRARFSLGTLLASAPVLCPQIEAAPLRFALSAVLRGLLGRRTVGLLLRPLPALTGTTLRLRAKRLLLKLLRRTPGAQVLTIVPFAIEPGFARIAHGWIHDLQNWDMLLEAEPAPGPQPLTAAIRGAARGRRVCCAIGRQDCDKGFDRFAALYRASPGLREAMLFAFGGVVAPEVLGAARSFADDRGYALDRFVSDAELAQLYAAADLIWCVYDPGYDQASGILGRAMQLGVPVAARRGSVIAAICAAEGYPCIELDEGDDWHALVALPPRIPLQAARARARAQGDISLARLAEALGVAPVILALPLESDA